MPARGARRTNPWIEYMRSTCSPGYRADKARRQAAAGAAGEAGGAARPVRRKRGRGDDAAAASRKRQRALRRMVEVPRKRKRIVLEDEPAAPAGLAAGRQRRVGVKRPARFL
jgi:hypothetical protein